MKILCVGWILFTTSLFSAPIQFDIQGEAGILINADTGAVLFEHDAHLPKYPASTTKIGTALYALKQKGDALDTIFVAEQDAVASLTQEMKCKSGYGRCSYFLEPDGTHIGIKKGEALSLKTLLQGLLICSGNDAANVIAQGVSPTIPAFVEEMNEYLKEIGCLNTKFCNPHGLHDPSHQSTAYDLALMAREVLKQPVLCDIIIQTKFSRPKTNKQAATTLLQTNKLLRQGKYYYPKAIGMKTGYHSKAKKTFVGAARSDGRTLIVVLLGYKNHNGVFEDSVKLFEAAFNQPKVKRLFLPAGQQEFTQEISYAAHPLQTYLKEDVSLEYYPAEDPQAKCLLYWHALSLPIDKDQTVGEVHLVSPQGEVLKKVPLFAAGSVSYSWPYSWLYAVPHFSLWLFFISAAVGGAFLLWRFSRHFK